MKTRLVAAAIVLAGTVPAAHSALNQRVVEQLDASIMTGTRSEANRARDKYRHPAQTLAFFGVKPTDTVVEIWPGGGYWTEILAPYLHGRGRLIVAAPPGRGSDTIAAKLAGNGIVYGQVLRGNFPSLLGGTPVPDGTADKVLTFRNVHNWNLGQGAKDKQGYAQAAFAEMYRMLKPGGILGVEEHRLDESADASREASSGYMKTSTVRRLAENAGFKFVGSSEINANRRDTKDYPKGVWTLPPSFAEGDKDRARYAAIGESDRMTLKFVKPAR